MITVLRGYAIVMSRHNNISYKDNTDNNMIIDLNTIDTSESYTQMDHPHDNRGYIHIIRHNDIGNNKPSTLNLLSTRPANHSTHIENIGNNTLLSVGTLDSRGNHNQQVPTDETWAVVAYQPALAIPQII